MRLGRRPWREQRAPAFTLIELVVSIVVMLILAALLLTGVQAARETARAMSCRNNLRQLGLGVLHYEQSFRHFPSGGGWSVHYRVGAYLEVFPADLQDPFMAPPVAIFLCPSDTAASVMRRGDISSAATNYAGNAGTWYVDAGFDGVFGYDLNTVAADIQDGLSNTAMLSEMLRADMSYARPRVNWNTPKVFVRGELDKFDRYCRAIPKDPTAFGWRGDIFSRGTPWAKGNMGFTLYNHVSPPGSPSCYNGHSVTEGLFSANSAHRDATHVCFADGHVAAVESNIVLSVWRELGSRAGPP